MYIIVKFIDAIIVLAILMIATLAVLNNNSYHSMFEKSANSTNTEATTEEVCEEPSTPIENIETQELTFTEGA